MLYNAHGAPFDYRRFTHHPGGELLHFIVLSLLLNLLGLALDAIDRTAVFHTQVLLVVRKKSMSMS